MKTLALLLLTVPLAFAADPFVRFSGSDVVEAIWATRTAEPGLSEWGTDPQLGQRVTMPAATIHRAPAPRGLVKLDGTPLFLRVGDNAKRAPLRIETEFHFAPVPLPATAQPFAKNPAATTAPSTTNAAALAAKIIQESKTPRGYCLVTDCDDARLAWELARQSQLIVVGISTNANAVQTARTALDQAGVYGQRISLQHVAAGANCRSAPAFSIS